MGEQQVFFNLVHSSLQVHSALVLDFVIHLALKNVMVCYLNCITSTVRNINNIFEEKNDD